MRTPGSLGTLDQVWTCPFPQAIEQTKLLHEWLGIIHKFDLNPQLENVRDAVEQRRLYIRQRLQRARTKEELRDQELRVCTRAETAELMRTTPRSTLFSPRGGGGGGGEDAYKDDHQRRKKRGKKSKKRQGSGRKKRDGKSGEGGDGSSSNEEEEEEEEDQREEDENDKKEEEEEEDEMLSTNTAIRFRELQDALHHAQERKERAVSKRRLWEWRRREIKRYYVLTGAALDLKEHKTFLKHERELLKSRKEIRQVTERGRIELVRRLEKKRETAATEMLQSFCDVARKLCLTRKEAENEAWLCLEKSWSKHKGTVQRLEQHIVAQLPSPRELVVEDVASEIQTLRSTVENVSLLFEDFMKHYKRRLYCLYCQQYLALIHYWKVPMTSSSSSSSSSLSLSSSSY